MLKFIKRRVASVRSVTKITRVVQLVATSKLKITKKKAEIADIFVDRMQNQLLTLSKIIKDKFRDDFSFQQKILHKNNITKAVLPFLFDISDLKKNNHDSVNSKETAMFVVVSSNKGLCGSLNSGVVKIFRKNVRQYLANNPSGKIKVFCIGGKSESQIRDIVKDKGELICRSDWYSEKNTFDEISKITSSLFDEFADKNIVDFKIFFNDFKGIMKQEPAILDVQDLIMNLFSDSIENEEKKKNLVPDPIFEQDNGEVFCLLVSNFFTGILNRVLFSHIASEYAMRMINMDNATKNGEDLIQRLTLKGNKIRQSSITAGLIDIVSGMSVSCGD